MTAIADGLIERRTWARTQNHSLHSQYEIGEYRVRVSVRADVSYRWQSRATAEVWSETENRWNPAATMDGNEPEWPKFDTNAAPDTEALNAVEIILLRRTAWALGIAE